MTVDELENQAEVQTRPVSEKPRHVALLRRLGIASACLVLSALVVLLHERAYTPLSPVDELQHIDYLEQASRFDFVHAGERVGPVAMREQACRTVDSPGFVSPPCDAPTLRPEQFQEEGFNTAAQDPPTYYIVSGLLTRVVLHLPGVESFVAAGRSIGVLWLGFGLLATYVLGRRLGGGRVATLGAVIMLASTPAVLHSSATITSDAPSLLVGGLLLLAVDAALCGRVGAWCPALAAALATSVKTPDAIVVGVAILYVLVSLLRGLRGASESDSTRLPLRHLRLVIGLAIGGALPLLVWRVVVAHEALATPGDSPMSRFAVLHIGWNELGANAFALVTPVGNTYVPVFLATVTVGLLTAVLNLLLISSSFGVAWFGAGSRRVQELAIAVSVGMLAGGTFFVLLIYYGAHAYFAIPSRYGLSLLPAAFAVLAVAASLRRWGGPALLGLGVLSLFVVVRVLV